MGDFLYSALIGVSRSKYIAMRDGLNYNLEFVLIQSEASCHYVIVVAARTVSQPQVGETALKII
jgi:hypothetical protein